jgi:hypothetical protein
MSEIATTTTAEIISPSVQAALDEHAEAIRAYAKRTIDDVLEIGRRLAEVKKLVGRAAFLPWLDQVLGCSEDTAEHFIALHALQRQLPNVRKLDLPLSGLYLLAHRSTPPEAVEAIVAKAEDGERVSVAEIKATVTEAKTKRKPQLPSYVVPTETAQRDNLLDLDKVEAAIRVFQQLTQPEKREFVRRVIQPMIQRRARP